MLERLGADVERGDAGAEALGGGDRLPGATPDAENEDFDGEIVPAGVIIIGKIFAISAAARITPVH
ncbi:MAG: hypothetical protein R3F11_06875 [Verrucomicrobiales bacterium]